MSPFNSRPGKTAEPQNTTDYVNCLAGVIEPICAVLIPTKIRNDMERRAWITPLHSVESRFTLHLEIASPSTLVENRHMVSAYLDE